MTTLFVTGGSGYLGRNLIRGALARGHTVRALARSDRAAETVAALGASVVRGDLSDRNALEEGMRGADAVVHSAAWVKTWGDSEEAFAVTVAGTQAVLDAAAHAKVARMVHVSTEAVLVDGRPIVNATEERPLPTTPAGLYPATKGEAERRVRAAASAGLHVCCVRPRAIWGRDDSVMAANLVASIDTGRFAWIDGGRPLTSTCHVDNVTEGIFLALERGTAGSTYFLTDGEERTIRAFFSSVLTRLDVTPPTKSVPRWVALAGATLAEGIWGTFGLTRPIPVNKTEVFLIGQEVTVVDEKARRELGYTSAVSFDEGLASLDVPFILNAARPSSS